MRGPSDALPLVLNTTTAACPTASREYTANQPVNVVVVMDSLAADRSRARVARPSHTGDAHGMPPTRQLALAMPGCIEHLTDYLVGMAVEESWHRIVSWLTVYAPQTAAGIRPPAGEETLISAEAAFARAWPADLRQWYRLHNGASSQQLFTGVVPGYAELLSLQRIPAASRDYVEVFDGLADEDDGSFGDVASLEQSSAGETAWRFLPSWVPIAEDGTACTMFVDCRAGERYGCVTLFEREDADTGGPLWISVEAMLADIAEALEDGRPCGGWQPRINDGVLEWEPAED